MRNSYYKNNIGKKDVSLIKNGKQKLLVFEGFLDFLSYLTLNPVTYYKNDYLIIHSVSLILYGIKYFKDYKEVDLYFDNDKAGDKLTNAILSIQRGEKLSEELFIGNREVLEKHLLSFQKQKTKLTDKRYTFQGYEDVNDYLMHIN